MQSFPSAARPTLTPTVPPGGLGPLIPKLGGGRRAPVNRAAFAVAFLVILADWLVFREHAGLSLALLSAAVGAAILMFGRAAWVAAAFAAIAPALLLVEVTALSVALAAAALAFAGMFAAARGPQTAAGALPALARFAMLMPFRAAGDGFRLARVAHRRRSTSRLNLAIWVMPVVSTLVFVGLFAEANPIFADILGYLDPFTWLTGTLLAHVIFWIFAAVLIWPFLRPARGWRIKAPAMHTPWSGGVLFGEAAILRALIAFNALFALQTLLDFTYLTGGAALPDGMTYAAYAQRGAYPLVATAMLAAGFVLAALRRGAPSAGNPLIRRLVYMWIGQNVILTGTAVFRNSLYVEAYGLTELRLAAFIWMGLVAFGLIMIVVRIAREKSGAWLVGWNTIALAATLVLGVLANTSAFIADYNVAKWLGDPDRVATIDTHYLMRLGPQAIPAIDHLLTAPANLPDDQRGLLADWRETTAARVLAQADDWRAFTIRQASLAQYLSTHDTNHSGPAAIPEL